LLDMSTKGSQGEGKDRHLDLVKLLSPTMVDVNYNWKGTWVRGDGERTKRKEGEESRSYKGLGGGGQTFTKRFAPPSTASDVEEVAV